MNKPPRPDPRVEPPTPPRLPAIRPKAMPSDEKPTIELDGIEILKGMLREVGENMRAEFRVTNANIDSAIYEITALKGRVGTLEEWRVDEEKRRRRNSERVAALDERTSSSDLSQDKAIAMIQADVKATKAVVDTVLVDVGLLAKNVNKIVASPTVKTIAKMIAAAIGGSIVTWLASKGVHLPALP